MSHSVRIIQADTPVLVESGRTILETALERGVPYPHGCKSGRCGACKSRLISGRVDLRPHTDFALSPEEKKQNLILACRAEPSEHCTVAWLDDDEPDTVIHVPSRLVAKVVGLNPMTRDIMRIRLEVIVGRPFTFSAGQYANVTFSNCPTRPYSMANRPDDPTLEFHVRHMPGGLASSYCAHTLKHGDAVLVEGPLGAAFLRTRHAGPILAIAGGSGLAPIKSIVETATSLGMGQPIHLYFGARDEGDVYLEDHFRALIAQRGNLTYAPVLSEPSRQTSRRTGLVTDAVTADWAEFDGWKAYVAGPPPMVEAAVKLLERRGIRGEDIHADAFYTELEKPGDAGLPEMVARR